MLVDDGALLIAGDSGAGKSALVATLMRTGSPVVADGYIFVDAGAPPTVRVTSTKVGLPPDGHADGRRARVPGASGHAFGPEPRPRPLAHVAGLAAARPIVSRGRRHSRKPGGTGSGGRGSMIERATTTWLASYPKSSNTWLRATYLAWSSQEQARLDRLQGLPMAASRQAFDDALGIDSTDLTADEIDLLRPRADEVIAAQDRRVGEIR